MMCRQQPTSHSAAARSRIDVPNPPGLFSNKPDDLFSVGLQRATPCAGDWGTRVDCLAEAVHHNNEQHYFRDIGAQPSERPGWVSPRY